MFGIVTLPVIPVRETSSHRSEMISQLIFGECFSVSDHFDGWIQIQNQNDHYTGWIEKKQITEVDNDQVNQWKNLPKRVVTNCMEEIFCKSTKSKMLIPAGAELPTQQSFTIGNLIFSSQEEQAINSEVNLLTNMFINAPYLWGGKTIFGFDCSGFSQTIFKILGHQLPRDAWQQAEMGVGVDFLDEVIAGDLAYFHNSEGKITHVGILLSPTKIIHCSGSVRIDSIDHYGIFQQELGAYTHELRFIKRVL